LYVINKPGGPAWLRPTRVFDAVDGAHAARPPAIEAAIEALVSAATAVPPSLQALRARRLS
jgi:hypothetical protein